MKPTSTMLNMRNIQNINIHYEPGVPVPLTQQSPAMFSNHQQYFYFEIIKNEKSNFNNMDWRR